jgi:hypothetical protein
VGDGKNEGEKGKPKLHDAEARAKSFGRKGEGNQVQPDLCDATGLNAGIQFAGMKIGV